MASRSLLNTVVISSTVAAMVALTGCATIDGYNAYGDAYGDIVDDIYKDTDVYKKHKKTIERVDKDIYVPAIKQRAANKVAGMGYRVRDVQYDRRKQIIKVEAVRGAQEYRIDLDYPSYNVINIKED